MSLGDIRMSSSDLLDKEELDAGGFGMVSLCFHRRHGLVVLKKVYTGPQRTECNDSLLEEGKMMHRLNHNRVLKLLGLILEDGNYSLVMEYMQKGNLMSVLKTSIVPWTVKGRFILEIIEGMSYLNEQGVVHKDLKPENILVDDDFHIKIADLGVATFKAWSKLTKEETNRQRKMKSEKGLKTNAGTLFYMAPEHLRSVHARPTQKSDVYSFGIVLWVIMTVKEPYECALTEEQVCFCILKGDRPNVEEFEDKWPPEVNKLMRQCWHKSPEERPTFAECDEEFRPYYCSRLEKLVEDDVQILKTKYPRPSDFVKRMESLQLDCVAELPSNQTPDPPHSLHSSQCLFTDNPKEEPQFFPCNEPVESEDTSSLERKLDDELSYHQRGSRLDQLESHPQGFGPGSTEERNRRVFQEASRAYPDPQKIQPPYQRIPMNPNVNPNNAQNFFMGTELPQPMLSNPMFPGTMHTPGALPRMNDGPGGFSKAAAHFHGPNSFTTQPICESIFQRVPVAESGLPSPMASQNSFFNGAFQGMGTTDAAAFQKGHFGYSLPPHVPSRHPFPESISLSNVSGVQIGSNNIMRIVKNSPSNSTLDNYDSYESTGIFECPTLVGEKHLNLVRDNLAKEWKTCGRKLGLCNPEIDEIDYNYERDGLKEKVYQMLRKWQMREGTKSTTVGLLARALYDCKRTDILDNLIAVIVS